MSRTTLVRALVHRPSIAAAPFTELHRLFKVARLDPQHIAAYRAHLGFRGSGTPLSYYYLLAQRAQLGAMLSPDFGHRVAGMVHVSNEIARLAEPADDGPVMLDTHVREEPTSANGAIYIVFEVVFVEGGVATTRVASRYLAKRGRPPAKRAPPPPATEPVGLRVASWALPQDSGRRYARLSGDYNPIHLWRWSAKLLGFDRPIIHGMHSAARAEAEIEGLGGRVLTVLRVEFRKPVEIGDDVAMHFDAGSGAFELWSAGVLRVRGEARAKV